MPRLKKKEPSLEELIGETKTKKTRGRKPAKKRASKKAAAQETPTIAVPEVQAATPADIPADSHWAFQGIRRPDGK